MLSPLTPTSEILLPVAARHALLVSSDMAVLRTVQQIFGDLSVETTVARDAQHACHLLAEHRYDGVIVDWDAEGGEDVLRVLRSNPLTRWAIALALVGGNGESREAFSLGANFTLEKPLNAARTARILQTARGMMNIPRRRATRVRVKCDAHYQVDGVGEFRGQGVDLSEGGIAVHGAHAVPARGKATVSFVLPQTDRRLQLDARIVWSDEEGRVGFRFVNPTLSEQAALNGWVKRAARHEHVPDRRRQPR